MTKKQQFKWWTYIITGIVLVLFVVPAMVSAKDDFAVIGGIVLLVAYGVVSYHFWVAGSLKSLKGKLNEK